MNATNRELAGFWVRFVAVVIDALVVGAVGYGMKFATGIPEPRWLVEMLPGALYHPLMWGEIGTTLGGMIMGIEGIRVDGKPMGYKAAVIRILSSWLSAGVIGLGYLWAAWDPQKQTWHDKLAGTLVVKKLQEPVNPS